MQRAFAKLTVKRLLGGRDPTVIQGIASTPSTDRMGDIVVPTGAKYALPIPLLMHHNATLPIGLVTKMEATSTGITFEAQFARPDEDGVLAERVAEAADSVKAGVLRGVSIGFNPEKITPIDNGFRFDSIEILELSLVAIPANQDASIHTIRAFASRSFASHRRAHGAGIPLIRAPGGGIPLIQAHRDSVKLIRNEHVGSVKLIRGSVRLIKAPR